MEEFSCSYQEDSNSKSSSTEEIDRSDHDMGIGRSYECVFCKRGFTTAQALGGHMNIHRKDRAANKTKPNIFPPSSSITKLDDTNYADLGFYSAIPRGNNYYNTTTVPDHREVDHAINYHQIYFPAASHHEVLCVENQRDRRQDWRQRGLNLYTNPLCVHENNKDKVENNSEEDDLDLELRLGHHP